MKAVSTVLVGLIWLVAVTSPVNTLPLIEARQKVGSPTTSSAKAASASSVKPPSGSTTRANTSNSVVTQAQPGSRSPASSPPPVAAGASSAARASSSSVKPPSGSTTRANTSNSVATQAQPGSRSPASSPPPVAAGASSAARASPPSSVRTSSSSSSARPQAASSSSARSTAPATPAVVAAAASSVRAPASSAPAVAPSPQAAAAGYHGSVLGPGSLFYNGPTLAQPVAATSSNGVLNINLTVVPFRFIGYINYTTRAYSYNGQTAVPGPTWVCNPGDTVTVTLINNLTANAASDPDTMSAMNTMHNPNTTNLHTHGLHVDPQVDNVFVTVSPGGKWTYSYKIPTDQPAGLYWYHAHRHGSSAMQVMGGLIGAIYVNPTTAQVASSADYQYLARLSRTLLVLQHFSITSANTNSDPFTVRTYTYLSSITKNTLPINPTFTNSSVQDIYMVNGQFQPKFSMTTGVQYILDIVNAVGDTIIELDIRDSISGTSVSTQCSMLQIASDGVYFTTPRTVQYVAFLPSNRATIIIQCKTPGTYYLTNYPDDSLRPGITDNETRFHQNMVTLVVTGSTSSSFSSTSSLTLKTIPLPAFFSDLQKTTPNTKWQLSVEQTPGNALLAGGKAWLGVGNECTFEAQGRSDTQAKAAETNTNCSYVPFPGALGDTGTYRHISYIGAIDELTINGRGKSPHMIHVHVNHMQIISDPFADSKFRYFYQLGDWKDTVPALVGQVVVRQNLTTFSGEIVLHCHYLMHEDMGMMGTTYIRPANGTKTGCNYPSVCKP
ncbi:UNVERIFIED_CONTAM: hypothetical protein HDU68_003409 [Siphonaria sp. JEL0065]|nr:hypothetical protein HDU68_003409 [Siphonaria sp. JEL0065]